MLFYSFGAGIDFKRQNLMSIDLTFKADPRKERVNNSTINNFLSLEIKD